MEHGANTVSYTHLDVYKRQVMEVFDDEFDYREVANHKDLTDLAVALFVGIMSAPVSYTHLWTGNNTGYRP